MGNKYDSNRLIAEFMGATFKEVREEFSVRGEDCVSERVEVYGIKSPNFFCGVPSIGNLKYDESWDWLMLVVERIESLGYISIIERLRQPFVEHRVFFNSINTWEEVANGGRHEDKLTAVYEAVLDFIQWKNKK